MKVLAILTTVLFLAACGGGGDEKTPITPTGGGNDITCNSGEHLEGEVCVSNTRSCDVTNGTGQETWNGSAWGSCEIVSCDTDNILSGGACVDASPLELTSLNNGGNPLGSINIRHVKDGLIYFGARDNSLNDVFGVSDGTEAGTEVLNSDLLVSDLFFELSGTLYFVAKTSSTAYEVWTTDGTSVGTTAVTNLEASGGAFDNSIGNTVFVASNNNAYLYCNTGSSINLCKFDGANTTPLDVGATSRVGISDQKYKTTIVESGGYLYTFLDNSGSGHELHKIELSTDTVSLVSDVCTGTCDAVQKSFGGDYFGDIEVLDGDVYFSAYDGTNFELHVSTDGASSSVVESGNIAFGNRGHLKKIGSKIYFLAEYNMFSYDGTTLEKLFQDGDFQFTLAGGAASVETIVDLNGDLLIATAPESSSLGDELYKVGPTQGDTTLVKDINEGGNNGIWNFSDSYKGSDPNLVFFEGDNGTERGVYSTDGTNAGTSLVMNSDLGGGNIIIRDIVTIGDYLYLGSGNSSGGGLIKKRYK